VDVLPELGSELVLTQCLSSKLSVRPLFLNERHSLE